MAFTQSEQELLLQLRRSIQADLDKGILTPQTPKTRPPMDIQLRRPSRFQPSPTVEPVVVVPKRLRRIILEDD